MNKKDNLTEMTSWRCTPEDKQRLNHICMVLSLRSGRKVSQGNVLNRLIEEEYERVKDLVTVA